MGPMMGGFVPLKCSASTVSMRGDGNSLMAGVGGNSLTYQLENRAPMLGAVINNYGVPGQTTLDMISDASTTDAGWVAGKPNVLLLWEGSNNICNIGRSAAQSVADMGTYIAARQAVHPWKIVLLTCLPRQTNNGQAQTTSQSLELDQYNTLLRANYRAIGAHVLVDVRQSGSPFNMADYNMATFNNMATANGLWASGETDNHIHLSTAGYSVVADYIVQGLRRLPAR